jgi:hypothetical protein
MTYEKLLARLGPLPTYTEVGEFLGMRRGEIPVRIHRLVLEGKLEAVQTNVRKRIIVASLFTYLQKQQREDANLAQDWSDGKSSTTASRRRSIPGYPSGLWTVTNNLDALG